MKKVRSEHLQGELSVTAGVFSKNDDLEVVFQGDTAQTNGSTVILPSLPHHTYVSRKTVDIARGYVKHEAGHVQHSDMPAISRMIRESEAIGNKMLPNIANALEDVWLERRVKAEYAGANSSLMATTTAVNEEFLKQYESWTPEERTEKMADESFVGAVALTWEGRKGYGEETNTKCLDLLPDSVRNKLAPRIKALNDCRNSEDVIALARMIDKDIREDVGKKKPSDKPGLGKPCEEGEEGEGKGKGKGEAKDDSETKGEGKGDERTKEGGEKEAEEEGGGDQGYVPLDTKDMYDGSLAKMVADVLRHDSKPQPGEEYWRPFSTEDDRIITRHNDRTKRNGQKSVYKAIVKGMGSKLNAMQRKLEASLAAQLDRDWETEQLSGRLDNRRLVPAYNCTPTVYKTRLPTPEIDTAVTLLVDLSGSMCGNKLNLAREVCVSLLECLDRLGTSTEVIGFRTGRGMVRGATYDDRYDKKWSRTGALDHHIYKSFNERLSDAKCTFSAMLNDGGGANSDGESLDLARERLVTQVEERKIMIVLSDGWPTGCGGTCDPNQHLRNAVERCRKDKIDCVGIGIMSEAVKEFYPAFTVCESLEDLPKSVIQEVGQLLVSDRYVASNADLRKPSGYARMAAS